MNGQRKPRRPRWVAAVNTLEMAYLRATKLTPDEIAARMHPLRQAFCALREGRATECEWLCLASAVNVSLSIEKKGVVRGLIEHLNTADKALKAINDRCITKGGWQPTALYFDEMEAVATAVSLFAFQLSHLSAMEYDQAFQHCKAETIRAGGKLVKPQANAKPAPSNHAATAA